MRRYRFLLLLGAAIAVLTAIAAYVSIDRVAQFTHRTNTEKVARIQARVDETFALLHALAQNETILSKELGFEKKARFLTDLNREKKRYMMLRILDQNMNVYKEGLGLASNLSSRPYLQKLYATGEQQVTDAFLAGADGKTINYTVAVAIKAQGKVIGALFAALYGDEFDRYLQDAHAENALVGRELQYMNGVAAQKFGMPVAQALELEKKIFRPVENILLDFQAKTPGSYWALGSAGLQYAVYAPVERTHWVVLTETPVMPLIAPLLTAYLGGFALLLLLCLYWLRKNRMRATSAESAHSQ